MNKKRLKYSAKVAECWQDGPNFSVLQSLHLYMRRQGQPMLALPFARFQGHLHYLHLLSFTVFV